MNHILITCFTPVLMLSLVFSLEANQPSPTTETHLPFVMASDFEQLDLVAWRIEQGRPDRNNPLVEGELPWDEGGFFGHGTVLRDPIDGKWKAWQISRPLSKPHGPGTWTHDSRLSYLESPDGVHWNKPKLSLIEWDGNRRTNLLLDLWTQYASVNIDPARDPPYEMFVFRNPGYPGASGLIRGLPLPDGQERHPYGLYRYHSKDGKQWNAVAGPLKLNTSDSCFIYPWDGGGYVSYHKKEIPAIPGGLAPYDIADGGLRLIGRRTSRDGLHWSDPTQLVMTPDWRDPADTQFMELCPLKVPGGYVATLTVYHTHTQRLDLQWAASRDGINWWRPDRRPALPNPPLGDYGGGMIWPMRTPVLDGNSLHVYYCGTESLHGELFSTRHSGPRRLQARGEQLSRQSSSLPDYGAFCRATWSADRLWALAPVIGGPYVGTATTRPRDIGGKKILVNVVTRSHGELRVGLTDAAGRSLPGFSASDCRPIVGDHHAAAVRWSGGEVAPSNAAKLQLHLKRAFLYGFNATP